MIPPDLGDGIDLEDLGEFGPALVPEIRESMDRGCGVVLLLVALAIHKLLKVFVTWAGPHGSM